VDDREDQLAYLYKLSECCKTYKNDIQQDLVASLQELVMLFLLWTDIPNKYQRALIYFQEHNENEMFGSITDYWVVFFQAIVYTLDGNVLDALQATEEAIEKSRDNSLKVLCGHCIAWILFIMGKVALSLGAAILYNKAVSLIQELKSCYPQVVEIVLQFLYYLAGQIKELKTPGVLPVDINLSSFVNQKLNGSALENITNPTAPTSIQSGITGNNEASEKQTNSNLIAQDFSFEEFLEDLLSGTIVPIDGTDDFDLGDM